MRRPRRRTGPDVRRKARAERLRHGFPGQERGPGRRANSGELNIPCLEGIGGSLLYLVERYGERSIHDVGFDFVPGRTAADHAVGLTAIDHLTPNVERGQMDVWASFYERSQIAEFIRDYRGEGIQYIALASDDIYATASRWSGCAN